MKRFDHLHNSIHEVANPVRLARTATAVAAAVLSTPGISADPAYARYGTDPTAPPPATGNAYRSPLPSNWPVSARLGQKDCSRGERIDRQIPLELGPEVAAMVDSRCEPPEEQPFAYVRRLPDTKARAIGRVYNGQFVRLDCQVAGRPVGDNRASFKNAQWFGITFRDRDEAQRDAYGYVSGANLGQVDTSDVDIPLCR